MRREFLIKLFWDDEASKWIAESANEDLLLALESNSCEALMERVKIAVQDILEVDQGYNGEFVLHFVAERMVEMQAVG